MERRPRTVTRALATILAALALVGCASPPPPSPPAAAPPPGPPIIERATEVDGHPIAYCGNAAVDAVPQGARRVVVVVHGLGGDACPLAAAAAASAGRGTVVIAPLFVEPDPAPTRPAPSGPAPTRPAPSSPAPTRWRGQGWVRGDAAPGGGPSSYAVLDDLITRTGAAAPGGPDLVVAGFSAGGQVVNRYAAVGAVAADRYLVMSPSSYLWFDDRRPVPDAAAACPTTNQWRYGLTGRNAYARAVPVAEIRRRYAARTITYLVGSRDDDPAGEGLDRSCAARAEGATRVARWANYRAALPRFFGPGITERQRFEQVPGVGHDGPALLRSDAGRRALVG